MLQLIVLRHVLPECLGKQLDETCSFESLDQPLGVLLQLLFFYFLICVQRINLILEEGNGVDPLEPLELLVVSQVLLHLGGCQLRHGALEDVGLVLEELLNSLQRVHIIVDVGCKLDHYFKWLVQEVTLNP